MSSSASNSEKGTKRKLTTTRRNKVSKKKLPAGIPVADLGHLKPRDAPSLGPETVERVVSRNRMAGENPANSQTLKRLSGLQNPEEIKRLMDKLGLKDQKVDIEITKKARLRAEHLKEMQRMSNLVFKTKSGLSKKAKASHAAEIRADQNERDKTAKNARILAEKAEKERQERESARQIAQIAKLKAQEAKNKNELPPEYKGPVYTNRKLLGLSTIKEEGRKKKGSKKGKKGKKGKLGHRKNKTKRN